MVLKAPALPKMVGPGIRYSDKIFHYQIENVFFYFFIYFLECSVVLPWGCYLHHLVIMCKSTEICGQCNF